MKHIQYILFIAIAMFSSCSEKNGEVERISNQAYKIISDSIYSRMPGTILYQDGIVYWEDVPSFEKFVHAVDVKTQSEITSFANKGEGPDDFTAPGLSLAFQGGLYINDGNKPLEILYQWDGANLSMQRQKYENNAMATRLLHLDAETTLLLCPDKNELFHLVGKNTSGTSFGERPIKDEINNAYDVFQGNVAYHPEKKTLVYSNLYFPYLAIYKCSNNGNWSRTNELKEDWDYTISEGSLKFAPDSKKPAMEMALTDDYIVLLQRDTQVEESVSSKERGRSMALLPHSLFIYDYNLKLKKIINMPFPMLRLCGDTETNTVYAMCVDPEFELISINLE